MRSRLSLYGVLIAVFAIGLVPVGGQQQPPTSPTSAGAQPEGPGRGAGAGRGGRGAAVRSPEVAPDQRVTFRLRAPNAKEVAVSFGGTNAASPDCRWAAPSRFSRPSTTSRFYEEEAEGVGHVWPLWRRDFTNFAQRVFR